MKPRALIIGASLVACGLSVTGVVLQGRQLDTLRAAGQRLQQQLQQLRDEQAKPASPPANVNPVISSPSPELLRLRNQVSLLGRRQRELASVESENAQLRTRVAAARTNTASALPAGYIRKSEARFAGYSSPENAMQTMLWAIQNRDFENFRGSFTPERAREFDEEIERTKKSHEEFFKGSDAVLGMNVVGRKSDANDVVELQVEIVPGQYPETIRFRQINGEWKMDSH